MTMTTMRIAEVAQRTGVPATTLRYYEEIGLLAPAGRSGNGYREYADRDLEKLAFITRAKQLDISLDELRELVGVWDDDCSEVQHRMTAVIASRTSNLKITKVQVTDSGTLNAKRRNNTTGGIVIEEGSSDFEVRDCQFTRIRGNGLWTHSLYTSPRLHDGVFAGNRFTEIGRDAIEVGAADHPPARSRFLRSELLVGDPPADGDRRHMQFVGDLRHGEILLLSHSQALQ